MPRPIGETGFTTGCNAQRREAEVAVHGDGHAGGVCAVQLEREGECHVVVHIGDYVHVRGWKVLSHRVRSIDGTHCRV